MTSFGVENLGPLLVFLVLEKLAGIKAAIAGAVVYVVVDVARRYWFKRPFPRLYVFSAAMTVGFGVVDLFAREPFMLRFEAVISNLVMAGVFFVGARGRVSMLQEIVEQKRGSPFVERPDLQRFFSFLTMLWAAYFFVKAVFYLWVGMRYPLDRAVEIRAVVGNVSLMLMIALTATQTRRIYWFLYRLGWLPARPESVKPKDF